VQKAILVLFFAALLAAGVLGTETRLLFLWPACALLGLAGGLMVLRPKVRVPFPPSDLCMGSVLLAVLYFAGRAVLSPVADQAREDWVLLCGCLVVYVIMVTVASHPMKRMVFLGLLLVLALGNLAVGAIHFGGEWGFHVVPQFVRSFEEGRIGGFYNNPNHLAAFFSIAVFSSLGMLCFGRGSATWKLVLGFVVVSCMLGMALTVSRGALLALAAGGLAFALLSLTMVWRCNRHLLGRLAFATFVIAVIAGGVLWKVNESYLRRRISEQDSGADVRLSIWRAALTQHAEQPWVGAGARMFYDGGVRYRQPEMPSWLGEAEFAHNEYVQTLADYGWIGLGLLGVALGTHLLNGLRFLRWFARERFPGAGSLLSNQLAFAVGAMAALVASAAHAVVEFHWHVGGLALLSSALLGLLANPGFEGSTSRPRRLPGVRPLIKAAVLAASVVLLWGASTWGRADFDEARATILAEQGRGEEALREMEKASKLDPGSARKAFELGQMRLDRYAATESVEGRRELLDGAQKDLARAAALNPFHFLTATALSDVLFAQGKADQALAEIHRALALAPLYEEPRLALALFYHRQGQFQEAERAYLWASEAGAANPAGTVTWLAAYRQLLMDAGSLPPPPAPRP
jgi:O-antigen ligase